MLKSRIRVTRTENREERRENREESVIQRVTISSKMRSRVHLCVEHCHTDDLVYLIQVVNLVKFRQDHS